MRHETKTTHGQGGVLRKDQKKRQQKMKAEKMNVVKRRKKSRVIQERQFQRKKQNCVKMYFAGKSSPRNRETAQVNSENEWILGRNYAIQVQQEEVKIEDDKKAPYFIGKAMGPAYHEYFRTETTKEKQTRLRCLLLGTDFMILPRLNTFLNGVLDPLQWQIDKARVS